MRKALVLLTLLLSAGAGFPAKAADNDNSAFAFQKGLEKGIEVGINFCRQETKQELLSDWGLIDAALNYKYLFLKGEVPPPLAVEETAVERKNGYAVVKREIRFYPPAYFPVDRLEYLRDSLLLVKPIVIPKGWIVALKTDNLPLKQIAYYSFLAENDGLNPVYVKQGELLVFGSYQRKSDAEAKKKELASIGIPDLEVLRIEKDITIKKPDEIAPLAQEIRELAQKIWAKEAKIAGLSPVSFKRGLEGVIYYLQKALAAADTVSEETVRQGFKVGILKSDLQTVLNGILEWKAEHQPYGKIITTATEYSKPTVLKTTNQVQPTPKKVQNRQKEIELLKEKLQKLNGGKL